MAKKRWSKTLRNSQKLKSRRTSPAQNKIRPTNVSEKIQVFRQIARWLLQVQIRTTVNKTSWVSSWRTVNWNLVSILQSRVLPSRSRRAPMAAPPLLWRHHRMAATTISQALQIELYNNQTIINKINKWWKNLHRARMVSHQPSKENNQRPSNHPDRILATLSARTHKS